MTLPLLLAGILLSAFFVSALVAIFSVPAVQKPKTVSRPKDSRGEAKRTLEKIMVPFNEQLSKEIADKTPRRDPTGACIVCGYDKNAHGWECIAYFMNMVAEGYQDAIQRADVALEDIEMGRQVSKLRAGCVRKMIQETKEITKAIRES